MVAENNAKNLKKYFKSRSDNKNMPKNLNLNDAEKEILILKAVWEAINSMLNYEVLELNHKDPDSSIIFKTRTHQQYFNIMLLDFLNLKIFGVEKCCLESLQTVFNAPQFNSDISSLQKSTNDFTTWLNQNIELEHDGETRNFWFPTINQEIALKITRAEYIKICGNISKHNVLSLGRQAETIQRIFDKNNVTIEQTQALLIMGEFYEQFHDDLFTYHASNIAEFLNNLRWGVYEYLQPLYQQSVECYWDDRLKLNAYRYNYPDNITNHYVREIFLNLMNDVRSKPYMPRFVVTRYFKLRY
jgi:hypothetical protein